MQSKKGLPIYSFPQDLGLCRWFHSWADEHFYLWRVLEQQSKARNYVDFTRSVTFDEKYLIKMGQRIRTYKTLYSSTWSLKRSMRRFSRSVAAFRRSVLNSSRGAILLYFREFFFIWGRFEKLLSSFIGCYLRSKSGVLDWGTSQRDMTSVRNAKFVTLSQGLLFERREIMFCH